MNNHIKKKIFFWEEGGGRAGVRGGAGRRFGRAGRGALRFRPSWSTATPTMILFNQI